jgi:hypothetical protein
MYTVHFNHEQALFMIHSGRPVPARPSMGSWVVFGLGTENQNLPSYVVLDDPLGLPINATWNWQNGFLPPLYQGTRLRSVGSPILDLQPDYEKPAEVLTAERDLIARALTRFRNDKDQAARALGLTVRTLYRRIKKFGLV